MGGECATDNHRFMGREAEGEDPVSNTLQTSRDKRSFRHPRKHCAGDVFR